MNFFIYARTMLANLFRKPVTTEFPLKPKEYGEQVRGSVRNDIGSCIFCGMCMRNCPSGAITVDRATKTWTINPYACVQCRGCVDTCPKKCLEMVNEYTEAATEKTLITLVKEEAPPAPDKPDA